MVWIHNIEQQGLLTNELKEDILKQTKLQRVEDLYRPFKQKKKTRATEAKRKGLESLAQSISDGQQGELSQQAEAYINDEVATVDEAIQGALDIIAEHVSDNPKYRSRILKDIYRQGHLQCTMIMWNLLRTLLIIEC